MKDMQLTNRLDSQMSERSAYKVSMYSCHVRSSTIDEPSYINEVTEYCVHGKYLMQLDGWKTNYSAEIDGKLVEKLQQWSMKQKLQKSKPTTIELNSYLLG